MSIIRLITISLIVTFFIIDLSPRKTEEKAKGSVLLTRAELIGLKPELHQDFFYLSKEGEVYSGRVIKIEAIENENMFIVYLDHSSVEHDNNDHSGSPARYFGR